MNERNLLFYKPSFFDVSNDYKNKIRNDINNFKKDYLLNINVNEVVDYMIEKYSFEPITLNEESIAILKQGEEDITDMSWGMPRTIRGNYIIFAVPFTGHSELLSYQPSTFNMNPPCAEVKNNDILICVHTNKNNGDEIKNIFNRELLGIKTHIDWINSDVAQYNAQIKSIISQSVNARKNKLLADHDILTSLGFPLRERKDSIPTYISDVKRKITIKPPEVNKLFSKPEPVLEEKEYEQIIKTLKNMILVMERSPKAFSTLGEEDLRTHFLVQLNGMYEGNATGETFNFDGKTDILIRVNGKNIFIAECKFWKGQKTITETIDQLLGYLSWRDIKIAILIFNRNKDFSGVLAQIPDAVKSHSNYKKDFNQLNETDFRFILKSKTDVERELIVSLLLFDIPK